jgi:hypothetical protein
MGWNEIGQGLLRVAMGWFVRKSGCWVGSVKGYCCCVSSDRSKSDERRWLGFWYIYIFLREDGRWWIVLSFSLFFFGFSLFVHSLLRVISLYFFFNLFRVFSVYAFANIFRATYLLIYRSFIICISLYIYIYIYIYGLFELLNRQLGLKLKSVIENILQLFCLIGYCDENIFHTN